MVHIKLLHHTTECTRAARVLLGHIPASIRITLFKKIRPESCESIFHVPRATPIFGTELSLDTSFTTAVTLSILVTLLSDKPIHRSGE